MKLPITEAMLMEAYSFPWCTSIVENFLEEWHCKLLLNMKIFCAYLFSLNFELSLLFAAL